MDEYKRLANSGQLLTTSQNALALIAGEDANLQSQAYTAKQLVSELIGMDSKLSGVLDMLEEATIQIAEASNELRRCSIVWISIPTDYLNLNSASQNRFRWHVKHHVSPGIATVLPVATGRTGQKPDDQADSQETLALAVTKHHQQALEIARALHRQHQPAICRRTCTA